jgi:methionine S-methyltransferase
MFNLHTFIEQCRQSSYHAFENFKVILHFLEDKSSRREARLFLTELVNFIQERFSIVNEAAKEQFHFTFLSLDISNNKDRSELITLLNFPSTFTPEEWSYTFLEGLSRYDVTEFQNKNLVELGCGNGWITIAIAKKFGPRKVFGLDINPRAVICSKINLYLNALDDQANDVTDDLNKESLIDKIEFYESDLLGYFINKQPFHFDVIFGCIPQVLRPENFAIDKLIYEDQSDDFLYSYSNYCGKQGYAEDMFGLGLIAKAVEQGIDLIKPGGKLIFNIGGRPGQKILERLFERRGFDIKKIWQRKVIQASDTEITHLIQLEEQSTHRFEFYMGLNSNEPISAKTAKYYADAGGEIFHSLTVYECTLQNLDSIQTIFSLLKDVDYKEALNGLDLCFNDKSIAEEKIHFLSALTRKLHNMPFFPYGETKGDMIFRKRIAQYLNLYFHTSVTHEHLLITPNLRWLISNIVNVYSASLILADADHAKNLRKYESKTLTLLEVPQSSTLLEELITKLKPQLVFFSFNELQSKSVECFKSLISVSEQQGTRLFIDMSAYLELSSSFPQNNGILNYLSNNNLPNHVAIICGLIKNQVYSDLEDCFLLTQNENMIETLTNSAELTYSRTPFLSELYYSELLFDLLKFQMVNIRKDQKKAGLFKESADFQDKFIRVRNNVLESFDHPCIKINQLPITKNTIRLDYGENELVSPKSLNTSLFESFIRQNLSDEEIDPLPEISTLLKSRFGINPSNESKIHFGTGVAPLFSTLVQICMEQHGTLLFPQGAYGYFYATARYFNVPIKLISTSENNQFKISPSELSKVINDTANCWIFLNFPLVNPTGAKYETSEIEAILSVPGISNTTIIMDTIFSGLEFGKSAESYQLDKLFDDGKIKYALLGGISKEFAGAGLRFGYLATKNQLISDGINKYLNSRPHSKILYACKKIYGLLNKQDSSLLKTLEEQRHTLQSRANQLSKTLTDCGWKVLPSQGGLFIVASPVGYFGKVIEVSNSSGKLNITLNGSNIHEALFYATDLLINNDVWTGIKGYCRFVLSVNVDDFENALLAIRKFYALV